MPQATLILANRERRTTTCLRGADTQPTRDSAMLGIRPFYASPVVPIYRCDGSSHRFVLRPGGVGEA